MGKIADATGVNHIRRSALFHAPRQQDGSRPAARLETHLAPWPPGGAPQLAPNCKSFIYMQTYYANPVKAFSACLHLSNPRPFVYEE